MTVKTTQSDNTVNHGDMVAGDKTEVHNYSKKTKLATLFDRLQTEFNQQRTVKSVSENLKKFDAPRDSIGLEQKLIDGDKRHLIDDAIWLKQEYCKKLTRFQFYEPAQEIHAFLLGIVVERFRNIVFPLIRLEASEIDVSRAISVDIVEPILKIIQNEGCNDVMGLSSTDIEGMIYFLTGLCHIKWTKQ